MSNFMMPTTLPPLDMLPELSAESSASTSGSAPSQPATPADEESFAQQLDLFATPRKSQIGDEKTSYDERARTLSRLAVAVREYAQGVVRRGCTRNKPCIDARGLYRRRASYAKTRHKLAARPRRAHYLSLRVLRANIGSSCALPLPMRMRIALHYRPKCPVLDDLYVSSRAHVSR